MLTADFAGSQSKAVHSRAFLPNIIFSGPIYHTHVGGYWTNMLLVRLPDIQKSQLPKLLFNHPFKFTHLPAIKIQSFSSLTSSLLDLCNRTELLHQIHARFILHGLQQNPTLSSRLIDRYSHLGHLDFSQRIFDSVENPDALLYNTIIRNLSSHGLSEKTLCFYRQMVAKSMYPDGFTYPFVLRACADLSALENGVKIHGHLIKLGLESDVHVHAALIEMYGEFNEFDGIQQVIEGMPVRDLGYWNALISGFGHNGDPIDSFRLFERMRLEGVVPDSVTLVSLLQSSVDLECLKAGRFVHLLTVVIGFGGDLAVDTAVLTMYSKLGSLEMARLVFEKMPERDCAVWNIMITEYTRNGYPEKALELLVQMGKSGVRTDLFTALAAISSVVELKSLKRGKEVHAHVIRNGSNYQASVDNSLIKMYANCGSIETARKVFDLLMDKTIISWSSMIKGYVSHNCSLDALSLFSQMRKEGIEFDSVTLIRILQAFVHVGALEQVKNIHGYLIKLGYNSMTTLVTALLVSYAKCGCIEIAQKLFDEEEVDDKDIVSWNSMISAYAKHGDWHGCFKLYVRMQESKVRPDQITFVGLLTACVNSGLVKEGWECFNQMTERYGCEPNQEHYACMVDLLGRMGHLNEAMNLIRSMPFKPDVRVWGPLLSACKMHSETRLAEFAAEKLIEMEPKNAGNYVLLSNIYAAAGKWDGVAKMRSVLRDRGLKKTPGCSWLEISGQVHEFRVADRGHPKSKDIYSTLRNLELEIKADADMDSNLLC